MNIINQIRIKLNLTQEEFGKVLGGVTPLIINRWEKEKVIPSELDQNNLYNLIKESNIDILDLIIENNSKKSTIHDLVLYHGSKKGIIGDILPISKSSCDFGVGFYMDTRPEQALMLVANNPSPKFYQLSINLNNLKVKEINNDLEWAMVIGYNRGYMDDYKDTKVYQKYAHYLDGYDVVIGKIADDRMFKVMTRFFEDEITDVVLINSLRTINLGVQYVVKTKRACEQIIILDEKQVNLFEWKILNDKSIEKRNQGIELTNQIFKELRSSGKYFDELLKEEESL